MCLLVVLSRVLPSPLWVAANRDEMLTRPTETMTVLSGPPVRALGGRDLLAGGTWMATNEHGVVAALTNTPRAERDPSLRSRGELPLFFARFATASEGVQRFASELGGHRFGPCWLLVGDREELYYLDLSNIGGPASPRRLDPGTWVLENRPLDAPSSKADRVRAILGDPKLCSEDDLPERLASLLADREIPAGEPPTSALRVERGLYGTRSSSIVAVPPAPERPRVRFTDVPAAIDGWRDADWPP